MSWHCLMKSQHRHVDADCDITHWFHEALGCGFTDVRERWRNQEYHMLIG